MPVMLIVATIAEILASPPAPYVQEISAETRTAFETNRSKGPDAIVASLDALVASGDMSAAEFAGEVYANGALGVIRDMRTACNFFEIAAPHRPDSAHNLATCYYKGDGRPQDLAAAREWYARASQGGWTKAHCALGNLLITSTDNEAEKVNGLALCKLAAELGDADAQTDIAGYLLAGNETERDPLAARIWLEKAAAQGHPNAAFGLAQIHARGDGTPRNMAISEEWARKSYAGGRREAATLVFQAIVSRMTAGAKTEADLDLTALSEAITWGERSAEHEPDPALRERAASLVLDFKRLQQTLVAD